MGHDCRKERKCVGVTAASAVREACYFKEKIRHMKAFYQKGVYVKIPTKNCNFGFTEMVGVIVHTTDRFFVVSSLYDPNVRFCCLYKEAALNPNDYKILTMYEACSTTDRTKRLYHSNLDIQVV